MLEKPWTNVCVPRLSDAVVGCCCCCSCNVVCDELDVSEVCVCGLGSVVNASKWSFGVDGNNSGEEQEVGDDDEKLGMLPKVLSDEEDEEEAAGYLDTASFSVGMDNDKVVLLFSKGGCCCAWEPLFKEGCLYSVISGAAGGEERNTSCNVVVVVAAVNDGFWIAKGTAGVVVLL